MSFYTLEANDDEGNALNSEGFEVDKATTRKRAEQVELHASDQRIQIRSDGLVVFLNFVQLQETAVLIGKMYPYWYRARIPLV